MKTVPSLCKMCKNAVSEDLMKNGLERESVSLTALDQTPFDDLDREQRL